MTTTGEIWHAVPSVPGVLASSEGRVMTLPRNVPTKTGYRSLGGVATWGTWDRREGRFLFGVDSKTYKVHRLICEAFRGPQPSPEAIVLHIDERSSNNRASNLKWGTYTENLNAPGYIEHCKNRTGEANPRVKAKRKKEAEWLRKLRQCDMFDSKMETTE